MNAEIYAEWLRGQGHRVIRTPSSYWHSQQLRVYQAFPFHWVIDPPEEELELLMRQNGTIGLRYSAPLKASLGCVSYHVVYEQSTYDINQLGKRTRHNIRLGLRDCDIAPLSFKCLAGAEGWRLRCDTLERQQRELGWSRKNWEKSWLLAADLPGFEAWGAFVGNSLAASQVTFQMEDCCYLVHQQSLREHHKQLVNKALSFKVIETMTGRPSVKSFFFGLHSLDAPAGVDGFKFLMGCSAKPVRQRIVFHPLLAPCFNRFTNAVVNSVRLLRPRNRTLSKASGMISFYLDGKRPIREQTIPEPVRDSICQIHVD